MRELERRYADVLTVVGVHAGKYHRERETARIREAALRLDNHHPIVNDRQFRVWRDYAVRAWPTVVLIGPDGQILGTHAGEFTAESLAPAIARLAEAYEAGGALVRGARPSHPEVPAVAPGVLRYPGKVALDGDRIAIADTGHHRVLVARLVDDGARARVERVVGSGTAGFADGGAGSFDAPQGLAFAGDTLYVADAGNHAVRAVSLRDGEIRTIAGTGHQLRTREDQRAGALSSPWDVAVVPAALFVAMAGIHQLWRVDPRTGAAVAHSGSLREDIVDGPHAAAALAQPMGIVAADDRLQFVDAESSGVRWADTAPAGRVGTIVGTGLFDFGDADGVGDAVRLQHPQGIARHADGRLLVADSYNDALRWVDPATRRVTTWVRGLHEPEGVACGAQHAYVADTNAHRLVRVAYRDGTLEEVEIAV